MKKIGIEQKTKNKAPMRELGCEEEKPGNEEIMKEMSLEAHGIMGGRTTITIIGFPDECPLCHKKGVQVIKLTVFRGETDDEKIYVIYQCPNNDCNKPYIGVYSLSEEDDIYHLENLYPIEPEKKEFEKEIINISEAFCKIYNQAENARATGLDEIAGIGYRKALEFLIKDYCILLNPGKKEEIKKEFLSKTIKTYIKDIRIKRNAEKAAWLGNDEAHYYRKWENKDIEDLLRLIKLTCHFISMYMLDEAYEKEMSNEA